MRARLWIYRKTVNTKDKSDNHNYDGEELHDEIIEPFGGFPIYHLQVAPGTSVSIGRASDNPLSLNYVNDQSAIDSLPEGSTLVVKRNGIEINNRLSSIRYNEPLTIKDHIEIIITSSDYVVTVHIIVIEIFTDSLPLQQ